MNVNIETRLFRWALPALFLVLATTATAVQAGKTLSGDEIRTLISGKTVYVTQYGNGSRWRAYFSADGSASLSDSFKQEAWHIDEQGQHCTTGFPLPCAPIQDNGDGTYYRSKSDGSIASVWTKIVDGKDF